MVDKLANFSVGTFNYPLTPKQAAVSGLAGAATFPALLGFTQVGIFKAMRLTSGSPAAIASVMGCASVLAASCAASCATLTGYTLTREYYSSNETDATRTSVSLSGQDLLLSTLCGAVVFRALGGRFLSVLPSNLLKPGSFAREWIPASISYAGNAQRSVIQEIGQRQGCHTCGRRRVMQFTADHQPPNALIWKLVESGKGMVSARFYPHCLRCSNRQGGLLSKSSSKYIVTHPFSLRLYHVFLPLPLGLAYLKTVNQDDVLSSLDRMSPVVPAAPSGNKTTTTSTQTKPTTREPSDSSVRVALGQLLSLLVTNFPLLIVYKRVTEFVDSFVPVARFHLTLWFFSAMAALGCV